MTLKAFEKYLSLDFKELAKEVGYSDETIEYGDNDIIVSFDKYDKKVKEYFEPIYGYLKSQDNIDEDLLKKADSIYTFIENLIF